MSARRRHCLTALAAILIVAACGRSSSYRPTPETDAMRRAIVLEALGQIGRPYRYGGTTPDGFDCSGLVQYVYARAGMSLPRSTKEQRKFGEEIELAHAEPGDLLFYSFGGGKVNHVAVYLGDGEAVHAPSTGRSVIVAPVDQRWWKDRFVDAVRVIHN